MLMTHWFYSLYTNLFMLLTNSYSDAWEILNDSGAEKINTTINILNFLPNLIRTYGLWGCMVSIMCSFVAMIFFSSPQKRDEAKANIAYKCLIIFLIGAMFAILSIAKGYLDTAVGYGK